MAGPEDFESRTEPATQRRRDEARQQGRVAFSSELVGGLLLLAAMMFLAAAGRSIGGGLIDAVRDGLSVMRYGTLKAGDAVNLLGEQYRHWLALAGGFFGFLLAVGVGASVAQVGLHLTPDKLSPDFSRLVPDDPLGRVVSLA